MLRDVLTNKWFLGGVGFLILLSVACMLWYQHDIAPEKKAAAETSEFTRQWEKERKAAAKTVTKDETKAPAENSDTIAEKPVNKVTTKVDNDTESGGTTEAQTPAAEVVDVPVSPHGLGPYPEVPADFPVHPFDWNFWGETLNDELMSRVEIKLWKQGIKVEGASFANGKVYPTILGTVYVRWNEDRTFPRGMKGHPDDDFDAIRAALMAGEPPPVGITVLDFYDDGIEPYSFLELNK